MNFRESESYFLSLGNEVSSMKLGLDSIRKLLSALGDPQKNYLKVQVAGTNGKGSVCAFLNSICVHAGIRTGMYTSPHLVSMNERVKIDGADINDQAFAVLASRVRRVSESLVACGEIENIPTYFEQVTAIALLAFEEAKVQLAILETGLGGRLDATTAANAEIAAITRIDYDHQNYLGETLVKIAAEKAAIIHESSRVSIGRQLPAAYAVVMERCNKLGIKPNTLASVLIEKNPPGFDFSVNGLHFTTKLGLEGDHQAENAALAILITLELQSDFQIATSDIISGLETTVHPGRLEWIGRYLLDGAHNVGGAQALRTYLDEFVDRPITMIFGAMSDKNIGEIGALLFSKADRLILTRPDNSRAMSSEDLVQYVSNDFDKHRLFVVSNAGSAIDKARDVAETQDMILVTGSLYLVGEVRRTLTADPSEKLKTKK